MFFRVICFVSLLLFCFCGLSHASDCRLRVYDGNNILVLNCEPAAITMSPFRVTDPAGAVWGISLVLPGTPGATKVMVAYHDSHDAAGVPTIRAVGFNFSEAVTLCEELQLIGFHKNYPPNKDYNLAGNVDCSATNPASPAHAGSLWQLGYAGRFPNGVDGIAGSGDEVLAGDPLSQAKLGGSGFMPINGSFTGTADGKNNLFDGKNKVVSNLYINRPGTEGIGFFNNIFRLTVKDFGLENVHITGNKDVGSLAGSMSNSIITHFYATGEVTGTEMVGGLVGVALESSTDHVYVNGQVTGTEMVGGLFGQLSRNAFLNSSYSKGSVTATIRDGGGLVGYLRGEISDSYSTASVSVGQESAGGLVGVIAMQMGEACSINRSYANGLITSGLRQVGGLIGRAGVCDNPLFVRDSFAATTTALVPVPHTYGVAGSDWFGDVTFPNTYWDTRSGAVQCTCTVANVCTSIPAGPGYWTNNANSPMNVWDFANTWKSLPGKYPCLQWQADASCT